MQFFSVALIQQNIQFLLVSCKTLVVGLQRLIGIGLLMCCFNLT